MQFRQTIIVTQLILLTPTLAGAGQELEPTKLCQVVTVAAPIVRLSDLLPAEAPGTLKARSAEIAMGSAPQPGRSRTVTRAEIKSHLIDTPDLLGSLAIPDRIVIERSHRMLTPSEVLRAIKTGLGGQALPGSGGWDDSDLKLSAPVYVTLEDPGLEVTRIELDPFRRQTKFRLWTSKEPTILPFWVTVTHDVKVPTLVARHDIPAGKEAQVTDFQVEERSGTPGRQLLAAADLAGLQTRTGVRSGEQVTRSMFSQVVLVEPGRPAKLIAEGPRFRISTTVIPLQAGVMGQQIRVRDTETQRILSAEVVARGQLKATL
jgi:flagella basal body P-ring formation protein FlgA